jgi:hypothetical protein
MKAGGDASYKLVAKLIVDQGKSLGRTLTENEQKAVVARRGEVGGDGLDRYNQGEATRARANRLASTMLGKQGGTALGDSESVQKMRNDWMKSQATRVGAGSWNDDAKATATKEFDAQLQRVKLGVTAQSKGIDIDEAKRMVSGDFDKPGIRKIDQDALAKAYQEAAAKIRAEQSDADKEKYQGLATAIAEAINNGTLATSSATIAEATTKTAKNTTPSNGVNTTGVMDRDLGGH